MVMMAVSAAAFVVVAVVVTTTATFARHHVDHTLNFFGRRVAGCHYLTHIVQVATGQGVVQIEFNGAFLHIEHQSLEAHSLLVHEGQNGAGINLRFVETSVHVEHLFRYLDHVFFLIGAESLFHAQREVETVAFVEICHLRFESGEGGRKTGDELERMCFGSFLKNLVDTLFVVRIEFVSHGDIAILFVCHVRSIINEYFRMNYRA